MAAEPVSIIVWIGPPRRHPGPEVSMALPIESPGDFVAYLIWAAAWEYYFSRPACASFDRYVFALDDVMGLPGFPLFWGLHYPPLAFPL